ncbi:hypothetical protein ERO13_A03G127200v2 [Gossypium hirsutum]|uniref:Uncharacterized protein n=3 Tax=Gossypium TaxID=3633 RepID=A0A2P5X2Z4_GOSBA|nr:hypothetical protein ES319_A03G139200v1 [Gossypium barbadense]KAG4208349.1 hypothetical protein ERO13_A03G127200v2 [Gossypium hirsutum]PPR97671.1 hypothetical protein GOBAR_AA22998 [Gossypium barbadense]TYH25283.1 hypothetical protein ES288_A03G156600v1 [Gossypium darwinii]TYJ43268.1 hypothetical protein E1A91_A03G142200v1 [Gossypium mustelinum]
MGCNCKKIDVVDGTRSRSFRYEDYNNRRAFLRSYPLQWGEDEDEQERVTATKESSTRKKPIKKFMLSVYHWSGEKVVVLRRFKDKLAVYVVACLPIRFKSPLLP